MVNGLGGGAGNSDNRRGNDVAWTNIKKAREVAGFFNIVRD